jgi:hypothetical protein
VNAIRELQDENRTLRNAITNVVIAASINNDALGAAISAARRSIGICDEVGNAQQLFPPISASHNSRDCRGTTMPSMSRDESPVLLMAETSESLSHSMVRPTVMLEECGESKSSPLRHDLVGNGGILVKTASQPLPCWSFLGADGSLRVVRAPTDIVPYLGLSAYSVAGQMRWAALALGFATIRAILASNTPVQAAAVASSVFGRGMDHIALVELYWLLHARCLFRKQGYIAGDHPGRHVTGHLPLCMVLMLHQPKHDYVSAFEAEERLRQYLGPEFIKFQAALSGMSSTIHHNKMRRLMEVASRKCICWGDGPRWSPGVISLLAENWLSETTDGRTTSIYPHANE